MGSGKLTHFYLYSMRYHLLKKKRSDQFIKDDWTPPLLLEKVQVSEEWKHFHQLWNIKSPIAWKTWNIKISEQVLGYYLKRTKRHTKNLQGDHADTQMKACTHTQSRKLLNKNVVSIYSWHPGCQGQTKHINFEILTAIGTHPGHSVWKIYNHISQAVV